MTRHIQADLAIHTHPEHGEGPVWDDRDGALLWVDIPRGQLHRFHVDAGTDEITDVGQQLGAVALREQGGVVLAMEDGFALMAPGGSAQMIAPITAHDSNLRFNDGKCDPAGRYFAGTMAKDYTQGASQLHRLDPDLSVTTVLRDLTISNGLAWAADGRTMYFIDTPTHGIDAFDYDVAAGQIARRRRIIDIPERLGFPDGMCIDDDGCLWVALYDGGAVHRYTPDARLDAIIELPVTKATSCAFGGSGLDRLFITTSTERFTAEQFQGQPLAGAVFVCEPGVTGPSPSRFAG